MISEDSRGEGQESPLVKLLDLRVEKGRRMDPGHRARVRRLVQIATVGMGVLLVEWILMGFLWSDASSSVRAWLVLGLTFGLGLALVPLAFAQLLIWRKKQRNRH